jgi:hypothetical protein
MKTFRKLQDVIITQRENYFLTVEEIVHRSSMQSGYCLKAVKKGYLSLNPRALQDNKLAGVFVTSVFFKYMIAVN